MQQQLIATVDSERNRPESPTEWRRVAAVAQVDPTAPDRVSRLTTLARRGLSAAYDPVTSSFAQTVRGKPGGSGVSVHREGTNLRYAAMAALGLSRLPEATQRDVLAGRSAEEIATVTAERAARSDDPGAVALAVWASVEAAGHAPSALVGRMETMLRDGASVPTVDVSWMLTAAVAAAGRLDTSTLVDATTRLLQRYHGPGGSYPHVLPPQAQSRWRAHVGSFADQVYPLQAMARASVLTGDRQLLEYANRTANAICDVQGPAGQWWWHYDSRDGSVVESYPVYSVHQHAMAPMVLFDLWGAGGDDHRGEIAAGLAWVDTHPEVLEELVSPRFGLVWRKVGRREPPKAARAIAAASTSLWQGFQLPGVDRVLPPVVVDHECRPYELGWLLYAWLTPAAEGTEADDA